VSGFRVGKPEVAFHVVNILTEEWVVHGRLESHPAYLPALLVDCPIERRLDKGILARRLPVNNRVVNRL
jgi:hypothetical protein